MNIKLDWIKGILLTSFLSICLICLMVDEVGPVQLKGFLLISFVSKAMVFYIANHGE